ncbi:MAG: hypothetical protein M0Z58_02250 [Nitrospiraceae bacterium]|nr:hypothetical protein [Nitrospiraceae bacterium]
MIDITISRLRKNRVFRDNLRLDVTPEVLFKPRFVHSENQADLIKETQGFSFYVEYMEGLPKPALMAMKTYCLRSKTLARITDVPEGLLWEAVRDRGVKDISGMYPLNRALEDWIKAQLG